MKRIVVPLLICGLMAPCAYAAPIEVDNPTTEVVQSHNDDLSADLSPFDKPEVRISVAGVDGVNGISTVGGFTGDMVSPLTTALSLAFASSESEGNSMITPYKDGERLHHTMTVGTATQKAITSAIPAEYSVAQSVTPEGVMKVSNEFGSLEPSTTLMVNMLTASHRAFHNKDIDSSTRDIFRGVISGFTEGVEEGDITIALKEAPTGVAPYVIDHRAHREGEVDDDNEEREGNGHTMVAGYIMSESATLAVSMVVPDDQVDDMKEKVVEALTPYMGVGEIEPQESEPEPMAPDDDVDSPGYEVNEDNSAFQ